jgi:Cu2+-exporting ATPase
MKKQALILGAFILTSIIGQGCGGSDKSSEQTPVQQVNAAYQCPMKCTEEKFDKPGKCPVCGMDLEKVAES